MSQMYEIVIVDIKKEQQKKDTSFPSTLSNIKLKAPLYWPPEKAAVPPVWSWAEASPLEKRSRPLLLQSPDTDFVNGLLYLVSSQDFLLGMSNDKYQERQSTTCQYFISKPVIGKPQKNHFPHRISFPTKFSAEAVNFAPCSTATT